MPTNFRTIPGVYTGQGITPRNIFASGAPSRNQDVPSLLIIDGTLSRDTGNSPTTMLRAGLLMGKVTTGGKYRPSIIGATTAAVSAGTVTSIPVTAATATEVARLIVVAAGNVSLKIVGPPSAAGTVAATAITCTAASGTTLTISSATLPAVVAGSVITPADGSQTPLTVLAAEYGVDVTDTAGTSIDQRLDRFIRGADLIATQIVNLVADDFSNTLDTSVQAYFKTQLRAAGGQFTFDNDRK